MVKSTSFAGDRTGLFCRVIMKPLTSSLFVILSKALYGMSSFSCGRHRMGSRSLPVVVAHSDKRLTNKV